MGVGEQHDHPTEALGGCEPFAVCMACLSEFSIQASQCDRCHVPLSVVRRCPGCSRILSARHSKCVHCGCPFLSLPIVNSTPAVQHKHLHYPAPMRVFRAAVFGIGLYTIVFSFIFYATHKLDHRAAPRLLSTIASSYALRSAPVYADSSLTGVPIAHVTGTVEVLDFAIVGSTVRWWHVTSARVSGFVRPTDFAPPKPIDAEKGYTLLR